MLHLALKCTDIFASLAFLPASLPACSHYSVTLYTRASPGLNVQISAAEAMGERDLTKHRVEELTGQVRLLMECELCIPQAGGKGSTQCHTSVCWCEVN